MAIKFKKNVSLIAASYLLGSCGPSTGTDKNTVRIADSCSVKEYTANAIIYQRESGEYRALAYQAFNMARIVVKNHKSNNAAIICDLDETLIDNSKYDIHLLTQSSFDFDECYHKQWMQMGIAGAVPGAKEFLQEINRDSIKIFYVSNRPDSLKKITQLNLYHLNFPDTANIFLSQGASEKQSRFDTIVNRYKVDVILWLGDNLNDFGSKFSNCKSNGERFDSVNKYNSLFGVKYIVLPNAVYGAWENNVYQGLPHDAQSYKVKRDSILRAYDYNDKNKCK